MSKKVVLALGGNAILQPGQEGTFLNQKRNIDTSVESIKQVIDAGYQLAIVHGNGPQVGQILQQNELASETVPVQPLYACSAQSQGYIGYILQESLKNALPKKSVVTLLTMTEVDSNDPGFKNPTKPIGLFYTKDEALKLEKTQSWTMGEDAGRGYRRLVASPKPVEIVESQTISLLLDSEAIVISTGGGGIPVVKNDSGHYEGVSAVIDKDLSALKLAENIDADILIILTDVPNVYINYGKANQEKLESITLEEAQRHFDDGQFSAGSMGPKMEACIEFAKSGKTAIICSLDKALEALEGNAGTRVSA